MIHHLAHRSWGRVLAIIFRHPYLVWWVAENMAPAWLIQQCAAWWIASRAINENWCLPCCLWCRGLGPFRGVIGGLFILPVHVLAKLFFWTLKRSIHVLQKPFRSHWGETSLKKFFTWWVIPQVSFLSVDFTFPVSISNPMLRSATVCRYERLSR